MNRNNSDITDQNKTFILAGYIIPCSETVVAWEFCYRLSTDTSVTFYPGIWKITGTRGMNNDYKLVQSNSITYNQSIQSSGTYLCQRVNLPTANQFTAPAGSVVGLYSNVGTQLLRTNDHSKSITTYRFGGNQSNFTSHGHSEDVNFNIAIRVHLGT